MFKPDMNELFRPVDKSESDAMVVEVVEYRAVGKFYGNTGSYLPENARGTGLRQVRVELKGGELVTEAGALQFMKGNVAMKVDNSLGGMAKGFLGSKLTNEASVMPRYKGFGEVYLEPKHKHFLIIEMQKEEIVADKGAFYCCESTIEVGIFTNSLFSGLAGGEGFFQTKLSGSGILVLESPVPIEQIMMVELNNDTLQVDGDYAILRRGNINFTVERSSKSLIGSARSGEGLLQTYRGTGEVWIIPALKHL